MYPIACASQSWLLHDVKLVRKVAELMPALDGLTSMSSDDRRSFARSVADHIEHFLQDLQEQGAAQEGNKGGGTADVTDDVEDEVEMWQSKVQLMVKVMDAKVILNDKYSVRVQCSRIGYQKG
jgi:hypothetical protein